MMPTASGATPSPWSTSSTSVGTSSAAAKSTEKNVASTGNQSISLSALMIAKLVRVIAQLRPQLPMVSSLAVSVSGLR